MTTPVSCDQLCRMITGDSEFSRFSVDMGWVSLSPFLHSSPSLSMGDSTSLPPLAFLWQPLALLGCHITPSPLCCLSSPTLPLSRSPCLPHSLFHSPCVLSVVFGSGVIIGQPVSHFHRWAVCLLSLGLSLSSSLFFNPPASELPMAVVCHLYTQDTLSLTDVTHNTLHGCHLISIPCSLSPSPTRTREWKE